MKREYTPTIEERLKYNNVVLKDILARAANGRRRVTFYTRTRRYIDSYRAIDTENKPFTLDFFTTHGDLIYYRTGRYEWRNISVDDIIKIEMEG